MNLHTETSKTSEKDAAPKWALPYETPIPANPAKRRLVTVLRIAVYALFFATMIIPIVQLESTVLRNQRKARQYDTRLQENRLTEKDIRKGRPKATKGAVNRWRTAVHEFWDGKNIYLSQEQNAGLTATAETSSDADEDEAGSVALHPNMPFVVILLTPFLYLPMWAGGLLFTIVKVLVVLVAILAAVRVIDHRELRMPDWIVGLGVVWWLTGMTGDIQHANTNGFVLGAIVFHLWFYPPWERPHCRGSACTGDLHEDDPCTVRAVLGISAELETTSWNHWSGNFVCGDYPGHPRRAYTLQRIDVIVVREPHQARTGKRRMVSRSHKSESPRCDQPIPAR